MAAATVRYELKADVNRVTIALQERDKDLVITESGHSTSDPVEIAALDANPSVKRAEKQAAASKKDGK